MQQRDRELLETFLLGTDFQLKEIENFNFASILRYTQISKEKEAT